MMNNCKYENEARCLLESYEFSISEIDKILSFHYIENLSSGEMFLNKDEISNRLGILFKGMLYAYSYNELGEKNISRFFYNPENIIVVDFESFLLSLKSEEIIECFEDSVIMVIDKKDLYSLYNTIPKLNKVGRILAEDSYIKALKKMKVLQSKKAKDRILTLRELSPELFQKLPVNYIASYLGMHRNTYNKAMKMK